MMLSTQPRHSFENRQVGFACPIVLEALPGAYPDPPIEIQAPNQCVDPAGLVDACFSGNKNDLTITFEHLAEPAPHSGQGLVTSDNTGRGIGWAGRRDGSISVAKALQIGLESRAGARNPTDEPIASTVCCLDESRRPGIIVESLAELADGYLEHCIADKCLGPDRLEKFIFCDELARPIQEVIEDGKGFRSNFDCFGASPETRARQIQA